MLDRNTSMVYGLVERFDFVYMHVYGGVQSGRVQDPCQFRSTVETTVPLI
jgi:hypothetical protein